MFVTTLLLFMATSSSKQYVCFSFYKKNRMATIDYQAFF